MTLLKSSNKAKTDRKSLRMPKPHELFDLRYFLTNIKLNWPLFMLFAIAFFLCGPLIIFFGVQEFDEFYTVAYKFENAVDIIRNLGYIVAIGAGIIAGLVTMHDFMKPASANFISALPVRREAHLLTRVASGIVVFAAAHISMTLLGMLSGILVGAGEHVGMLIPIIGEVFMIYLFIYTLMVVCATLCGSSVTQTILAAIFLVVPPAVWALAWAWVGQHVNMWENYFTQEHYWKFFPGMKLVFEMFEGDMRLDASGYLYYGFISLIFIVAAVILIRMRINERTSDAAMFKPVATVAKYSSMTLAAMLGGYLFYESAAHSVRWFWWMFGWMLCALLTFMLVNAVVHRSAKAVLRGLKWTPIFAGIFLVLNFLVMNDIANISNYVPNPGTLSSADVWIDGMEYEFRDKEVLKAVAKLASLDSQMSDVAGDILNNNMYETHEVVHSNGTVYVYTTEKYVDRVSNSFNIRAVFHVGGVIPIPKTYFIFDKLEAADALTTIANSAEFTEQYGKYIADKNGGEVYVRLDATTGGDAHFSTQRNYYGSRHQTYMEDEKLDFNTATDSINAAYFNRPQIGNIMLYGDSSSNIYDFTIDHPLYLGDPLGYEVERVAVELEEVHRIIYNDNDANFGGVITPEILDDFIESSIEKVVVKRTSDDKETTFTDTAKIREILTSVQGIGSMQASAFSIPSSEYWVTVHFDKENVYTGSSVYTTFFLDGQVPAFIG